MARKRRAKVERRDNKLSRKTIGDKSKAKEAKRANKQPPMMRRLQQPPTTMQKRKRKKKKILLLGSLCR